MSRRISTAEAVTIGHPDKMCDIVADALLDAYLEKDRDARVALEVTMHQNKIWIMGEVSSIVEIPVEQIVRDTLLEIGYDREELGMNATTAEIFIDISKQSPDIALAFKNKEYGAGDQGIMIGYATNETESMMPLPITLAHLLCKRLVSVRQDKILSYIRPDGKVQVSVEYENTLPKRVDTVVLSTQHDPLVSLEKLRKDIIKEVIFKEVENWIDEKTQIYINPTGRFVLGGPCADSGLTGRKIISDSYGPYRHGGGAYSGKDPTKVDRSAAYYTRYVAKNVVEAGYASRCEIEVSYAIGVVHPLSVTVDTFGTNTIPLDVLEKKIKENFCFNPSSMIEELHLKNPIYKKTAFFGHFGYDFSWEETGKFSSHNNA